MANKLHQECKIGAPKCVGNFVIHFNNECPLQHQVIQHFASDPHRAFRAGKEICSAWKNSDIEKSIVQINHDTFFVKHYHCLGPIYRIKNMFRKSKALKAWHNGMRFREAGIATPLPVICLEHRRYKLLGDAYLVCEHLPDARDLLEIWPELDDQTRMRIIYLAGREIGNMHHKGFLHGDLNWRNILVRPDRGNEHIYLIDLDGSRYTREITKDPAQRDLKHFYRDFRRNHTDYKFVGLFTRIWQSAFNSGCDQIL